MLPRSQRLTSAQFDRAFANSQSVRHPLLALKAHQRDDDCDEVRAAFVVPKKQGKAVQRNRTRRRLRARYRLHKGRDQLHGCDLILLSTPATHNASGAEIDDAIDEVLRRMERKLDATPRNREAGQVAGKTRNEAASERLAGLPPSSNLNAFAMTRLEEGGSPAEPSPPSKSQVLPATRLEEDVSPALAQADNTESRPQISLFAAIALAVIRFYQRFVSPGLPPSCRFYPSCSRYTYGAIERFGLARGLWLGSYRVCRCHPWNAGGIDEVPDQFPAPRTVKARSIEKLKAFFARRRFDSPRN